jgi:hypothetical protein
MSIGNEQRKSMAEWQAPARELTRIQLR